MVTLQGWIDELALANTRAHREYEAATARLADLHAAERAGQRIDAATVVALRGQKDDLKQQMQAREQQIARLEEEKRADEAIAKAQAEFHPTGVSRTGYERQWRVGAEPRTYAPPAQRGNEGPSFLRDLFAGQLLRDPAALGRLERHGREVEVDHPAWAARAVSTAGVAGFVPPAYVIEQWAAYARSGRPTPDLCLALPLPESGMTVTISRVTTPTIVGSQATQNTTVANQDLDDTLLTVNINTLAGYVDVSRQALERGLLVEQIITADLAAAYGAELDRQVLNGSGAGGEHLGILGVSGTNSVVYTDATPSVFELWPKLASALGEIQSGRFTGATGLVLSPATWAWLLSAVDNDGRPLFVGSAGGVNAMGTLSNEPMSYGGRVGVVQGVPVYLSGNVPTNAGAGGNETRIIAADFRDIVLWEDATRAPMQLRFEEPVGHQLTVRLIAYGYSAFTAGRQPKGVSVISGSGCITPAL